MTGIIRKRWKALRYAEAVTLRCLQCKYPLHVDYLTVNDYFYSAQHVVSIKCERKNVLCKF